MSKVNIIKTCIFFGLCCTACQTSPKEQPTLSDETMSRILADVAVAEAATQVLSGFPKDSLAHLYYMQVLEMHGTTQEEYEKNLRLLSDDPAHVQAVLKQAEQLVAPAEQQKPAQ